MKSSKWVFMSGIFLWGSGALLNGSQQAGAAKVVVPKVINISLAPNAWNIRYSPTMPAHPKANGKHIAGWYFNFPVYNGPLTDCNETHLCPGVHYVTTPHPASIPENHNLVVTFRVATTGNPTFNYKLMPNNTCISPAKVRPFLQIKNDDMVSENNRWWANPVTYELGASGDVTLTIPLTLDKWSNVYGHFGNYSADSAAGFRNVLSHMGNIGFTFGGGCFFGHGVNVSGGTAQFIVTSYSIQ